MEARPESFARPGRVAWWLGFALAGSMVAAGCVRFDDSAVGDSDGGSTAIDRRDGGDARGTPQPRSPDAAGVATASWDAAADAGALDLALAEAGPEVSPVPDAAVPPLSPADAATGPIDVPAPVEAASPDVTPPTPDPTSNGLLVHWQFDEGRGESVADTSGKGHAGALKNGAAWGAGVRGGAVVIAAANDYVEGPAQNLPAIEAAKSVTFFLWRSSPGMAMGARAEAQRTCAALSNPAGKVGIQVGTDRGRPAVWQWGQDQGFAIAPRAVGMGWVHIAYSYDGSRHRLYVDGELVDSSRQAAQKGKVANLLLGAYDLVELDNEKCQGRIDEFRVYDRSLSDAEVAQLAKR
jgi:hypothetical protein